MIFSLLDVFMRMKMLSFLFHKQKSTKSIKLTKTQISEQATFLTLDVFMLIKMLSFLFLFACMRFVFFARVKFSCKKNKEVYKCPNTLIYYTTDVYPPQLAYGKLFYYLFLFTVICQNLSLL